jgi:UDP-N-acetylmuramoylalanine--D-glutamate ligase
MGGAFSVEGRRVVVVGAARSGLAAARLLVARGADVVLTDAAAALPDEQALRGEGIALELGGHSARTFVGADLVVLSPGVPPGQAPILEAREAGVEVIGEMELASRWLEGPIVAVTGTKGKSTTTTLIGRMLAAAGRKVTVGGNIGAPLSGQVAQTGPGVVHVVEASSFQLEGTVRFRPAVAVFLNFSPDHLDRHATVEEYAAAKARIFANQGPQDVAVVNAGDEAVLALAASARARQVRFSVAQPVREGARATGDGVAWIERGRETPLIPRAAIALTGEHMLANVAAAAAVARVLGVAAGEMTRALHGFTGLEHAMEPAGQVGGVRFVNDSKATNVEAARQSIRSFTGGLAVIMGGRFKGGDLRSLRHDIGGRAAAVVAIGEAAPLLREAFGDLVPVVDAATMADAVRKGWEAARPDGVVLLAPACASFDMFADYAERGRVFRQEVARLGEAGPAREL